ncbi:MAG: succinate dehydrogenase, cytochrome b556 subunit [Burkholderiales bacterium]
MSKITKPRPGTMRLIDALQYRLPVAGVVSILHRASGAMMFFLLPFVLYLFDNSLASESSYARLSRVFAEGSGVFSGWMLKLMVCGLIWAYLHHFIAGLRHLWMDATHSVSKEFGRQSAHFTLVASVLLTLVLGYRIFV